jgi:hypothetical protein
MWASEKVIATDRRGQSNLSRSNATSLFQHQSLASKNIGGQGSSMGIEKWHIKWFKWTAKGQ